MSKQEMARELIGKGNTLSFNTLRKYSVERLEAMLHDAHDQECVEAHYSTMPAVSAPLAALQHHVTGAIERGEAEAIVEVPAYIPTDAELMRPVVEERTELDIPASPSRLHHVLALVCAPWLMLKGIVGL